MGRNQIEICTPGSRDLVKKANQETLKKEKRGEEMKDSNMEIIGQYIPSKMKTDNKL